jgi:hypothetical protein
MDSDEIVDSLQPYGIVTTYQHKDKTFSAKVDLFMHGMNAEVQSGFRHRTMNAALSSVYSKVMALVGQEPGARQLEARE